jgi:hypothetical protein
VLACRFWDNNDKDDDNGRSLKASNHILTQRPSPEFHSPKQVKTSVKKAGAVYLVTNYSFVLYSSTQHYVFLLFFRFVLLPLCYNLI